MEGQGKYILIYGCLIGFFTSCSYYKNEIFIPPVSEETSDLVAMHVDVPVNSINASYWSTADYLSVQSENIITGQVNDEDGILNVNGMTEGVEDLNNNQPAGLTLKAAYDDEYVYILAAWQDAAFNVSNNNWVYNGPADPDKVSDTTGWTSQRNDDNLILSFQKSNGDLDIWKWSLALSEPLGFAIDMYDDGSGAVIDAGNKIFERNINVEGDNRSGPKFEWDGVVQEITRDIAGLTILDPGYYLMHKTEVSGDVSNGDYLYLNRCAGCHGKNGMGDGIVQNTGVALNTSGWLNRYSREGLDNLIGNEERHAGALYWNKRTEQEKLDLGLRLKAFAGIPGYYLLNSGGSDPDVMSQSNVVLANINTEDVNSGYKVLIVRKLDTGHSDDIHFDLSQSKTYDLHVYLTDNDDMNIIGEEDLKLIFK